MSWGDPVSAEPVQEKVYEPRVADAVRPPRPWFVQYRSSIVVGTHALLFTIALFSAFLLSYNFRWGMGQMGSGPMWLNELFLPLLAIALPVKLFVFHWTDQYRGSWRYVGLRDLVGVLRASLVGTFFFLTVYFALQIGSERLWGETLIERRPSLWRESSVFLLDWAGTMAYVCAARILVRFFHEEYQSDRAGPSRRVLIVGAGDTGEVVLRELLRARRERYQCVGFLDDETPHLRGRIHGVEVLARTSEIREVCEQHRVQEVFIAMPHASPKTIRALVARCEGAGVLFRTIPAVTDVIEGRVRVSQMREMDIVDLLGREPVELDTEEIAARLCDKGVLVTGAGGSIGSEMCRQIIAFAPRRLILLEQTENALFDIDRELRRSRPDLDVVSYVADVADAGRVRSIMERERPSVVFHAAAHKHVPMMELNPGEAVKNNVGGTAVVADTCLDTGVERMVLISSDKAVNPTSMMGCTKRLAEMYTQSLNAGGGTVYLSVRFGNVLGSSGSVVPIFKQQIAEGGPVTVTHPDMKRYFMTIPEAAQLVLQAGAMGKGGEIYVLHMGEPVRIVDLARDMITLCGLRPGIDIDIVFTGIRPGEKLFEELSNEHEDIGDTAHPKIGIWKHGAEDSQTVRRGVERLLAMADKAAPDDLRAELKRLVPEYTPFSDNPGSVAAPPDAVRPRSQTSGAVPF